VDPAGRVGERHRATRSGAVGNAASAVVPGVNSASRALVIWATTGYILRHGSDHSAAGSEEARVGTTHGRRGMALSRTAPGLTWGVSSPSSLKP
jgi:hypothetical protein